LRRAGGPWCGGYRLAECDGGCRTGGWERYAIGQAALAYARAGSMRIVRVRLARIARCGPVIRVPDRCRQGRQLARNRVVVRTPVRAGRVEPRRREKQARDEERDDARTEPMPFHT
jgi:hypothetical protein